MRTRQKHGKVRGRKSRVCNMRQVVVVRFYRVFFEKNSERRRDPFFQVFPSSCGRLWTTIEIINPSSSYKTNDIGETLQTRAWANFTIYYKSNCRDVALGIDFQFFRLSDTIRADKKHQLLPFYTTETLHPMTHLIANIASASGRHGLSTILQTREAPRPFFKDNRVVDA